MKGVRWIICPVVFLALELGGRALPLQQKYLLKETKAVGDVSIDTEDFRMSINMHATVGGQQSPPMPMVNREERTYRSTILALDAKGWVTSERRTYSRNRTMEQQPGEQAQYRKSSLEGKTVLLRRGAGRTVVTVTKGKIDPRDRKDLSDALSDDDEEFYPRHAVGPGDEWTMDSKGLAKAFGGAEKAVVKGRFLEVVQRTGHPCAHALVTIEVVGRPKGAPVKLKMNLKGDLYYALDLHRSLTIALTGPITASGEITQGGTTALLSGEGSAQISASSRWIRVAGKPVRR